MNTRNFFKKALKIINLIVVLVMTLGSPFSTFALTGTDWDDYAPGEVVTIFGDNSDGAPYVAGEWVKVDVTGPRSESYYHCDATVAELDSGLLGWSCQITLSSDPAIAVGVYSYIAAFESGFFETGTFTDGGPSISPLRVHLWPGDTQIFTASGGNAPYTFSLIQNRSGGSITSIGEYVAGSSTFFLTTDTIDIVRVTDAKGLIDDAYVYVGDMGNGETIINGCMEETSGDSTLQCTANDVRISNVDNIIISDACEFPGDYVTFTADYHLVTGATKRYDIGLYFAVDGDPNMDGALGGQCSISTLPYEPTPPFFDFDGTMDGVQDTCGDSTSEAPLYTTITLTVECIDDDGDGYLDLPYCSSWDINDSSFCTSPLEAYPGTGSKCNCEEGFSVEVPVPGQIIVDKVTDPSGADAIFDFNLTGSYVSPVDGTTVYVDKDFTLTDGDAAWKSVSLYTGIYVLTELEEDGWEFGSVSCTSSIGDTEAPASIELDPGEIVTCVFYNTRDTGSLQILKTVSNPDGATLPTSFTVNYDCGDGYTGQESVAPGSPATVPGIPTGSVCTVTEVAPDPIPDLTIPGVR